MFLLLILFIIFSGRENILTVLFFSKLHTINQYFDIFNKHFTYYSVLLKSIYFPNNKSIIVCTQNIKMITCFRMRWGMYYFFLHFKTYFSLLKEIYKLFTLTQKYTYIILSLISFDYYIYVWQVYYYIRTFAFLCLALACIHSHIIKKCLIFIY